MRHAWLRRSHGTSSSNLVLNYFIYEKTYNYFSENHQKKEFEITQNAFVFICIKLSIARKIKATSISFLKELDKRRYEKWERRASRGYSVQDFLSIVFTWKVKWESKLLRFTWETPFPKTRRLRSLLAYDHFSSDDVKKRERDTRGLPSRRYHENMRCTMHVRHYRSQDVARTSNTRESNIAAASLN